MGQERKELTESELAALGATLEWEPAQPEIGRGARPQPRKPGPTASLLDQYRFVVRRMAQACAEAEAEIDQLDEAGLHDRVSSLVLTLSWIAGSLARVQRPVRKAGA